VTSFVLFGLGLMIGVMATYIYLKIDREATNQEWKNLEARVQVNEEQLAYLSMKIEQSQHSSVPVRQRKGTTQNEGRSRALSLLAEGADPSSVARATNTPLGQVELINRLHRKDD